MNVAGYQAKSYPSPPCWSLVADVYTSELGLPVDDYKTVSNSPRDIAAAFSLVLHKGQHGFFRLAEPVDFAVVLMGKTRNRGMHHAGIFYEGSVLHATEEATYFQDLASLRDEYELMEFWAK